MKVLVILAAVSLTLLAVPSAEAKPDLPACVGYESCYEETGDGFAVFCVQYKGTWKCGQCEACGNGPLGRHPA